MSADTRTPPPPRNPDDRPGAGGRPSKFNDDVAIAILEAVLRLNYRTQAAAACGVSRQTLSRWLRLGRQYPDGSYGAFRSLLAQAERVAEVAMVTRLNLASDDDPRLGLMLLERRHPRRWGAPRVKIAQLEAQLDRAEEELAEEREERERLRESGAFDEPTPPAG